jgi:hypothetical protein
MLFAIAFFGGSPYQLRGTQAQKKMTPLTAVPVSDRLSNSLWFTGCNSGAERVGLSFFLSQLVLA